MNNNVLFQISSFAVCVPFLTGLFLIKKIDKVHHPFLYLIVLALVTEISNNLILNYYNTAIAANILILADAILIIWAFKKWGLFTGKNKVYRTLLLLLIFSWSIEAFIQSLHHHYEKLATNDFFLHG